MAQRPHSATMQQLGQFGEENKHFLPVLGLAAPQPTSSGFPGLLGWGNGGRTHRGAEGRYSPSPPQLGSKAGEDIGSLGEPSSEPTAHGNSRGHTHQARVHLAQP